MTSIFRLYNNYRSSSFVKLEPYLLSGTTNDSQTTDNNVLDIKTSSLALIISGCAGLVVILLTGIGLCIYLTQRKERYQENDTCENKTPASSRFHSQRSSASFSGSDVEYVIHDPSLHGYLDVNKIYENACYKR